MHDALAVGIPMVVIIAGILLNRQDASALRSEMAALRTELRGDINGLRAEMNSRFDSVQRDMREFYGEQSRHEVRITALEQPK
jgi:hypothetical protein